MIRCAIKRKEFACSPGRLFCIASMLSIYLLSGCATLSPGGSADDAANSSSDAAANALPLHEGTFISADVPCGDPPLAALLFYNGRGFDGAHSHACRARVVARRGNEVTLANSCIDADHFVVRSKTRTLAYRRCRTDQLPPGLRQRATAD